MDELHRRGQPDMTVAADSRPALAAARVSMGRSRLPPESIRCRARSGISSTLGRHALADQLVGRLHVGGDQRIQPLDRGYPGWPGATCSFVSMPNPALPLEGFPGPTLRTTAERGQAAGQTVAARWNFGL